MRRWLRYWFADGGRDGVAIVRIAIAISVWMSLDLIVIGESGAYRALGPWLLAGSSPPPTALVDVLWIVARVTTITMLLGLGSRLSTALSFVSAVSLAALSESGATSWSHGLNVVFVAQLALLGARSGDALSLDALIRKRRGLPPHHVAHGYTWSLRLVQLAVALMFVSGMFHKVLQGGVTLDWALSDNLRHHLLVRYDITGAERPAIVDWMLAESWRYQLTAMLNLVAQTLPLAACFLVRYPLLRLVCGASFVLEVIALDVVMQLPNYQWLPLATVFVDWDWLLGKLRRRISRTDPPALRELPADFRPRRSIHAFIIAFVIFDTAISFVPKLDQRLRTYPFSSFPMFAQIRARKPYSTHQPYSFAGGYFEVTSTTPLHPLTIRSLNHVYRKTFAVRDREQLRRRMEVILADVRREVADATALRMYYSIFEAPAYPAPASLQRKDIAIVGELDIKGNFRSLLGSPRDAAGITAIEIYADDRPEPLAESKARKQAIVAVTREGDREQRWLIATKPR